MEGCRMKADFALIGGTALCLVLIPLAVIFGSGTPLGSAHTLNETPAGESAPVILHANGSSGTEQENDPSTGSDAPPKADLTGLTLTNFQILDSSTNKIATVSALDYVTGAIAAEMPASFSSDALTAQGIASYTNAVYLARLHRGNPPNELKGADFSADPGNLLGYLTQKEMHSSWGDHYDEYYQKVHSAAREAVKYLLFYEGEPILAAYHAISAGQTTEDSGNVWSYTLPYLCGSDSGWDQNAPGYESSLTLTLDQFRLIFAKAGAAFPGNIREWPATVSRSNAGYVTRVQVGTLSLSGQEFRNLLGLRSSCFTYSWDQTGENITLRVKGYGHGVGLSQYGAEYLSNQGKHYSEILAHYYPGTKLVSSGTISS